MGYYNMRNVYICQETHDDAVKLTKVYFNTLKGKDYYYTPKMSDNKTEISCGSYNIQFLSKRQWAIKESEAPQTGYLTIPYNRILLSLNGVKKDQCNLKGLQKLLIEDKLKEN